MGEGPKPKKTEVLLSDKELKKAIQGLANDIHKEFPNVEDVVILGIRTRGMALAERIKALLDKKYGTDVAMGVLDITFYRDDLSRLGPNPMIRGSKVPVHLDGKNVILVDDVLYTGRTVRAALDSIADYGRPEVVRLAVVVDRGMRELPIQPDYCPIMAKTNGNQRVRVMMTETDDEDQVLLDTMS
jgi:pyrimidine operon attenuation protein / uracil phosphoribosyltransferase